MLYIRYDSGWSAEILSLGGGSVKVLVIGGTGSMGRRAVTELAPEAAVEQVTIAGRDEGAGRQVQQQAAEAQRAAGIAPGQGARLPLVTLDVTDREAVRRVMAEHDVILNAAGPAYLLEEPLVRAALAAGRSYVSLCDDADAVEKVLPLDEEARAAGISVMPGMGWTPGLTNLAVRHAVNQLDEVDHIHIAWVGSSAGGVGKAVVYHVLHTFSGQAVAITDGRPVAVPAGSEPEQLTFPHPIGKVTVRHVSHPETVTIPRYIPGVRSVTVKGGLPEPVLNWLAVVIGRSGLAATHRRRDALWPLLKFSVPLLQPLGAPPGEMSGYTVEVAGRQDGRPVTIRATSTATMADLTAVPAAVAVLWLGQGKITRRGVFAPEAPGGPDPAAFLAEMAGRGVKTHWEGLPAPSRSSPHPPRRPPAGPGRGARP